MKQVNVSISFEEEKLTALKRYMAKKELEPETELADALLKLYEKHVPAPVREYIDENDVAAASTTRPRRPARPAVPKPQAQPSEKSEAEVEHHEQS